MVRYGGAASAMVAAMVGLSVCPARAEDKTATQVIRPDLTIDASLGLMSGMAKEYVFDASTGAKISRLDWKFSNIAIFTAGVKWRPVSWLMMGVRASTSLTGGSLMNDFDFNDPSCPPVPGGSLCHSNHPATQQTQVFMGDIHVGAPVAVAPDVELTPLVGYKYDTYKWAAYHGTANYVAPPDLSGLGISYRQNWRAPYIGLALNGRHGAFGYEARLTYSPFASGFDRDHHHIRSLIFTDRYRRSSMIAAHLGLSYAVTPMLAATLGYDYQRWSLAKGSTVVRDLLYGDSWYFGGSAAGASQQSHTLSLGLRLRLGEPARKDGAEPVSVEGAALAPVWEGVHAGLAFGGMRSHMAWRTLGLAGSAKVDPMTASARRGAAAAFGSAFAGYSRFLGPALLGIETDVSRSTTSGLFYGLPGAYAPSIPAGVSGAPDSIVMDIRTDASLRLRAGFLVTPTVQLYATGGLAIAHQKNNVSCVMFGALCLADRFAARSRWAKGLTGGVGAEWAMAQNWFARIEYRYSAYARKTQGFFDDIPSAQIIGRSGASNQRISLGIGYRM